MLTCHVGLEQKEEAVSFQLLREIRGKVAQEFGIKHMTVQLEKDCCHPEGLHCNLDNLLAQHKFPSKYPLAAR
jgi:cobalt-zinc-cadmium efflux system protein